MCTIFSTNPNTGKMRKRYYLLFVIILTLFSAYNIFTTTDLFVPKQVEIENSKGLFKEMLSEITKIEPKADTIYFVNYDIYGICGTNHETKLTEYQKKIKQINYNKENPYFINMEKVFDEVNLINNKTIIIGKTNLGENYKRWFYSNAIKFDLESKNMNLYRQHYRIINKSNVEIVVTENGKEKIKLFMTYKNGKWNSKTIK